MEKLLYISTVESGPYQGVRNKINMQCMAFTKMDMDVVSLNCGERSFLGQIEKLFPYSYGLNYRLVKKKILSYPKDHFQYCFIRYSSASRGLWDILKTLKETQKQTKIILEIPSYPYEDELRGLKSLPFKIRDKIFRGKLKQYADLAITPSHLERREIFGMPALEITNGIDIDSIKKRLPVAKCENKINIIGVALLTSRQGFDRVIKGIYEYNKTKKINEPNVCFYVIGAGEVEADLLELTEKLELTDNVIFTGEKRGQELENYYNIADVGVGTLAMYRTGGLKKVNSLKTREYCAKGLPFIITHCDYIFDDKEFEFCMVINNDNTPVDIRKVIKFLNDIKSKYSEEDIIKKMRHFAEENLSWVKILKLVIDTVNKMKE